MPSILRNPPDSSQPHTDFAIPFQRPSLPSAAQIDRYLGMSREAHWFSNNGPCCRLLSDRLADRVGAYCVPVASGTLGLMIAAASLRQEVHGSGTFGALMPSFTFLATAQSAIWSGFQPRLIDVDPAHWHVDASRLERVLREQHDDVSLVIPVCSFGTPPPSETRLRWERACKAANLPLLMDSAAAFGAVADDGVPVGAQGDIEVVSFHATKPFAIGEGGAVFTRSRTLHERIAFAANFGLKPDRSVATTVGLNAKMSESHAAIALAVLDEYDTILESRRGAAQRIRVAAPPDLTWQLGSERSTWQFIPVVFPDTDQRQQTQSSCANKIDFRVYYEPLHTLTPFSGYPTVGGDLATTIDLHNRILCLPMANDLSSNEVQAISNSIGVRDTDDTTD